MNKTGKEQIVNELTEKLKASKATFVADYRGLTVDEVNTLRQELSKAGVEYRVVKNTLLKLAAKGTGSECLEAYLSGPTAIAIAGDDPVAPAKILSDFAKGKDKFQLKIGSLDGKILSTEDIRALAELPSREVLLSKMLSTMNAPVSNFVGVLAAVPRSLVQVLGALGDKKAA